MSPPLKIVLLRALQAATASTACVVCLGLLQLGFVHRTDGCGQLSAAKADLKSLSTALEVYRVDTGSFPLAEGGLQLLLLKPSDPKWKGPYVDTREIPADPWGNTYQYQGLENGTGFELICLGPDGRAGTEDDIRELRRSP